MAKTEDQKKSVKFSLAMPERVWQMLQEATHRTGLSNSSLVQSLLLRHLPRYAGREFLQDVLPDPDGHRTSFVLTEEVSKMIQEVAARTHSTPTTVVRALLVNHLDEYRSAREQEELDRVTLRLTPAEDVRRGLEEAGRLWGLRTEDVVQVVLREALPGFITRGRDKARELREAGGKRHAGG